MDILGIGLPELILIATILLIVLGPDEMQSAGRKIGKLLNKIVNSEQWGKAREVNRQVRNLPNQLAREANIADLEKDIKKAVESIPKFPDVPIAPKASSKDEDLGVVPSSAKNVSGNRLTK